MSAACRRLKVPVISGNVSLYNETKDEAIYPTPVVGMVGLVEKIDQRCTMDFKQEGDLVFLLGGDEQDEGLAGSEYLELQRGKVAGKPTIDLDLEKQVQGCCLYLIRKGLIRSAHDCSDGGLAITLAESCIAGGLGFVSDSFMPKDRIDVALFGEAQSRIVISVAPDKAKELEELAARDGVPLRRLGRVGGKRLIVGKLVDLPLDRVEEAWWGGLQ
jgi:phosphoribosylformylglycinamidine synthase